MQAAENFVIAVNHHDRAQGKAHDKKGKRLQAFRVGQGASGNVTQITAEMRRGVKNHTERLRGRETSGNVLPPPERELQAA
jgi:hypothetical protein